MKSMTRLFLLQALLSFGGISACNYHIPTDTSVQDGNDLNGNPIDGGGVPDGQGNGAGGVPMPAFQLLSNQLLKPKCASCHNSSGGAGGINLSSHASITSARNSRGTPVISAGSASGSLIVQVIESGRMPPVGGPVDAKLVEILKCWITKGAPSAGATECVPVSPQNPGGGGGGGGGGGTNPGDTQPPPVEPPPPEPGQPIPFRYVFEKVLLPSCVGCHSGPNPREGIDLSSYDSIMRRERRRQLVEPGDPERSMLWQVVSEDEMPFQSPPLADGLKQILRQWIIDGAQP